MTPPRKIKSKKQSAAYRRSENLLNFKTRGCLVLLKKLKIKKVNMKRTSNTVEPKRYIFSKKDHTTERRPEIRIIKAVSNASKPISKESGKIKSNVNIIKNKSNDKVLQGIDLKFINKTKPTQSQNISYPQKLVGKLPEVKNIKKVDTNINERPAAKKQIIKKRVEEETPIRSKRTPKPNRKYLNDTLITSFKSNKVLQKINDISDSESEIEKSNASSSDVDSEILIESDSTFSAEEYEKPSKSKSKLNLTAGIKKTIDISPPSKPKLNIDITEKSKLNELNKVSQNIKNLPVVKTTPLAGKTIILNKFSYNQPTNNQHNQPTKTVFQKNQLLTSNWQKTISDKSLKTAQSKHVGGNVSIDRKRKLIEPVQKRETIKIPKINEKTFEKDNFDSDIELNDDDDDDIDNTDIDDFIKELTAQKQMKFVKKLSQASKPTTISTVQNPYIVKKPMLINRNVQQSKEKPKVNENKKQIEQPVNQAKKVLNKIYDSENHSPQSISDSDREIPEEKNDDPLSKTVTSTLEDFEKMPTFTIVNINDIIGKKGDFMLEKMKNDPLKPETTRASPETSDENDPSRRKKIDSSSGQKHRRKAMHTNLLSENFDKNKDPPPRTPFPPPRKNINNKKTQLNTSPTNTSNIKILNNNLTLSKSVSSSKKSNLTLSNKSPNKGPPRILNSMVAKKTTPITTFSTKVDTRHSNDMSDSDNEKIPRKKPSKENIKNQLLKQMNENKLENKFQPTINNNNNSNKRKLPNEKVIIQRQGNKIIKKITCFETWYVINLPQEVLEKENTVRNIIGMPLIHLANQASTIDLPNSKWTCKVSLQKCTPSTLSQNSEPYTGEIYDDYINPEELHKYRPTNVMFRRQALHPTPKVPYDRAVIFKNNTFFTNIEGKNVKLLGAPHQIDEVKDIEILLNLIDEFSLKNQFVELAPYIP